MRLSFLFDGTVRLIGRIFLRCAAIALLTMIPAGFVAGFTIREFAAAIGDAITIAGQSSVSDSVDAMLPIFYAMVEVGVAAIFFGFACAMLSAASVDIADAELHGEPRSWQAAFARAWRNAVAIFVQYIVQVLLFGCVIMLIGAIAGAGGGLEAAFAFIAAGCACVWIFISWTFGAQAIVCDQYGPLGGLGQSKALVRGRWWKVLWILIIFGLCTQFLMEFLQVPLSWFMLEPINARLSNLNFNNMDSARKEFNAIFPVVQSYAWSLGALCALGISFSVIMESAYKTVFYLDLQNEDGDIGLHNGATPEQPIQTV